MNDRVILYRTPDRILTLRHSRVAALISLGFLMTFFLILLLGIKDLSEAGWPRVVILVAAFLSVVQASHLAMVCRGLAYSFDPVTHTIRKNNKRLAAFEEVKLIQIRSILLEGGGSEYRLVLVLRDEKNVCLASTRNEERIMQVADEVASMIEVPLRRV